MKKITKYLVVLLSISASGWAQTLGTIRGTVTDSSGAPVPEVAMTVENQDTGLKQSANTGTDGVYNFVYLPVGNYRVSTEKVGFRKSETTGVRVDVASVVDVDIRLTV